MSDSRIFFGSLESQERLRIIEERKDETFSTFSGSTQMTLSRANIPTPPVFHANPANNNVEILPFSEESQEARKRHEEMLKKYELQKASKNINVPTNDYEIKIKLRELKQPICYFGEGPAERRERLKTLLAKILMESGSLPAFNKTTGQIGEAVQRDEENEYFLYEGEALLKSVRMEISKDSLKNAAIRIEKSKIKKITVDPLEEEDIIDNEMKQVSTFEMKMCQFGDCSSLIRGNFLYDQSLFATSGGSGDCKIWSIPDCELKTKLMGHCNRVNDIKFHPQAMKQLSPGLYGNLATVASDNTARLWTLDLEKHNQRNVILKGHEDRVNRLLYHNLGTHLITTSHDKTWRFWDIERTKELLVQTGHARPVYTCSLHPDGSLVFTGDLGGYGMLWDLRMGRAILPITGHVKQILCSSFSSNGYHLATGSDDNTVRLWDLRRKNCFYIIPAHTKLISDVVFQPNDSRFLATASYDNTCKVWSCKDWSLVKNLVAHEAKVTSISVAMNGEYIATTSHDRKWMLWTKNAKNSE